MEEKNDAQETDVSFTLIQVKDAMGKDADEFVAVMAIVDAMIKDPQAYTGHRAVIVATQLAALRTKISIKAQYYKTCDNKGLQTRKRKDVLLSLYQALEENINCLKLMGRMDATAAGIQH
jgi:hypothetical protein